jgi:hypothetical protein
MNGRFINAGINMIYKILRTIITKKLLIMLEFSDPFYVILKTKWNKRLKETFWSKILNFKEINEKDV